MLRARPKPIFLTKPQLFGTPDYPRLTVYKSNRYFSWMLVADDCQKILMGGSSVTLGKASFNQKNNLAVAELAKTCLQKLQTANITKLRFDRNGYRYHGKIKTFTEYLRANNIKF